jgi:dTDP-4-amino-4,6-dideoxygalactose transaminase
MKVPLLNPSLGNKPFLNELLSAAGRILSGGQYILGSEVDSFEEIFSNYFDGSYSIGVSSGTDALIASLIALGVRPGHEVICPSFTFFATAGAIHRVGAVPVFVDILPGCFTMDPSKIQEAITDKTRAIIPVHLFGQSADLIEIMKIAKENGLVIIEDAAQAIGSEIDNRKIGTLGKMGCFSFFPSKNLGGFGDAGLITTSSNKFSEKLKCVRNHGMTSPYNHTLVGGNFRIDALQAALLKVKLKYLETSQIERQRHASIYLSMLKETSYTLPITIRGVHVYNQFTIRVPNGRRNELQNFLLDKEISSAIYYPVPLHLQPCFLPNTYSLLETEKASKECLSIPITAEITDNQIEYVAENLIDFINR